MSELRILKVGDRVRVREGTSWSAGMEGVILAFTEPGVCDVETHGGLRMVTLSFKVDVLEKVVDGKRHGPHTG